MENLSNQKLVHLVFFWLKNNLSQKQKDEFDQAVKKLVHIESVQFGHVGTPSATKVRPIRDDSFSFALTVAFENLDAHDQYQIDPTHTHFVETYNTYWEKILIYDASGNTHKG